MNRFRKFNNNYEILNFPHLTYHSGLEFVLGNWLDKNFGGFSVETFFDKETAVENMHKHPDFNFDQIVLFHKEIYNKLYEIIIKKLKKNSVKISFLPMLKNSRTLMNDFYDRIKILKDKFRLIYHMTDIISFNIIVEEEQIANHIARHFIVDQELKILYVKKNQLDDTRYIKLVGKTDIGTAYQIIIFYI